MKITLSRINIFSTDYGKIRKLYNSAFPDDERAPIWILASKAGRENVDFWGLYADGEWFGLAYVVTEGSICYLFYFAVAENMRKKGLGSKSLQALKKHYADYRFFLALEQLDESAENYEERLKRRNFYLRNGLKPLDLTIREASVIYDVMGTDYIKLEEYELMMKNYLGKRLSKMVSMQQAERQ